MHIRENVALASLTTLELGGPARWFVEAESEEDLFRAAAWARARNAQLLLLGGGSNVVVADGGVNALVVQLQTRGIQIQRRAGECVVTVAGGENWDAFVARCVEQGWQGVECLSGIPGTVGSTPIQNVGAYGQEVAETICGVRVMDLKDGTCRWWSRQECNFAYRTSAFRQTAQRFVVLEVRFALRPGAAPCVRYEELARQLEIRCALPSLATVREAVLELRRSKSMLVDRRDWASRSVGSFFVNPIVAAAESERLAKLAVATGLVATPQEIPMHATADGRIKLAAAWLVEKAGFPRGTRRAHVAVSPRHALALVHCGGGTAEELVALARAIRAAVRARFGIDLRPEPVFWGFPTADPTAERDNGHLPTDGAMRQGS